MAGETVLIQGDTYAVKEQLKTLGGKWDATAKGWRVPADRAAEAKELVENQSRTFKRGERWEPCPRRYCGTEPVCNGCGYCEKHCTC